MQRQLAPLQTDQVSQEVLRNLYCNESKPDKITPLDLALTSYLIARKAFDSEIFDSQATLAVRLSTDYKAIKRSLERLDELGWITYRGRGDGLPKGISLNLSKLPAAQPLRDKITPDAGRLVDYYLELRKRLGIASRLPRNWRQRQLPSAQRLLTLYGSYDKAAQVVQGLFNHADRGIQKKARKSLHNLFATIPKARKLQSQEQSRALLQEIANQTEAAFSGVPSEPGAQNGEQV